MLPDNRARVAVIGGGIAGLVSAWELACRGVRVELFERDAALGGRVRSGEVAGVRCDLGAESFATRGGGVEALLQDLNLTELVERPNPHRSWVIPPEFSAPMPPASFLGIPAAPLSAEVRRILGVWGALRAACEPILPRKIGSTASTVAQLVKARLGERVLSRLVSPVVRGVYSTDPSLLPVEAVPALKSARENYRSLRAATRSSQGAAQSAGAAVAGLSGGMGGLVSELERQLTDYGVTLHLGAPVRSVIATDATDGGFQVSADGAGDLDIFEAAIITTPELPATENLVTERSMTETNSGDKVEIVALLLDDERLNSAPRGTGALVASGAQHGRHPIRAKALTHSSAKWGWLANQLPKNRHLIRLSYGEYSDPNAPGPKPRSVPLNDASALTLACTDASEIFGFPIREEQVVGMLRHEYSLLPRRTGRDQPQSDPGPTPGKFFAGEWVAGTGLASVIPAARSVASECFTYLSKLPSVTAQIGDQK